MKKKKKKKKTNKREISFITEKGWNFLISNEDKMSAKRVVDIIFF